MIPHTMNLQGRGLVSALRGRSLLSVLRAGERREARVESCERPRDLAAEGFCDAGQLAIRDRHSTAMHTSTFI